jgi:hypothetical protein
MIRLWGLCFVLLSSRTPLCNAAAETDAAQRVKAVITAAGGEENLLKRFRFRERVIIGSEPPPPVAENEPGNRTSVVDIPDHWWVGTEKRNKEKVRLLVWAWTLQILLDPKSKVELIPASVVDGQPAVGLRVTESVKEPIDMFFETESLRLAAIDYQDTRHSFRAWKKTADGRHYSSQVVGFRFANRETRTLQEKQWYQTDILELTPLTELPADLKP